MPCVHMKLAYCKHTIATIQKFGLISMRLGRGKFKNHTAQKRGRSAKNTPALEVDDSTPSSDSDYYGKCRCTKC